MFVGQEPVDVSDESRFVLSQQRQCRCRCPFSTNSAKDSFDHIRPTVPFEHASTFVERFSRRREYMDHLCQYFFRTNAGVVILK